MCLILVNLSASGAIEQPQKARLTIVVIDSVSKAPLEAASITMAEQHQFRVTNEKGIAVIDSLPKGYYTIQCAFVGYHPIVRKIWVEQDTRLLLELCPENTHLHEVEINSHSDALPDVTIQNRTRLDARYIERNSGINLSDQLKQIAGVNVLSSGPSISKPVIRGLHSNRLVTVNNGVRQEGQQWGADHGTEIDPFSAASIEVIKGAASVEFGAEAIGGVIRLSPREFRTKPGANGELQLNGASNNGMGASSLLFEGAFGNKHQLSWRTQGSFRKAGDARTPDYVLSNTAFEEQSVNYALHYGYRNFHIEWNQSYYATNLGILRAAHVGNSTDLLAAIQTGTPAYQAPFTYKIDRPNQEVIHTLSSFKLFYQLPGGNKLQLHLSRQNNERKEFDRPPRWATSQQTNPTPQYYLQLTTDQVELSFAHTKWRSLRGQWGVTWMNQGNVSEGLQPIIPNFSAYSSGAYLIEKWQKKRLMLEAGIRYDYRDQTRYYLVNKVVQQEARNYGSATFSFGGAYWLDEHLQLQGNVSSAWRAPGINELYSNGLHGGTATYETGNPNLLPERSYNAEVSLNFNNNKWLVNLSIYRNLMTNFIYKLPLPEPIVTIRGAFPQFIFVQSNALLQGAEMQASRKLGHGYTAGINASYLYAQNTTDNLPLIFMPANRVRASLGWDQTKWWKLNDVFVLFNVSYTAHQSRYPAGIDYTTPPPAYWLFDLSAGNTLQLGKQPVRWSISVYNAFNNSYRDYLSRFRYFAHEPGRNIILRLIIPFNIIEKHEKLN